jgi:hypothetical protein
LSDAHDILTVVNDTIAALRRHGIPYFVTGSFASSVHGEFRATNDLDVVADLDERQLRALLDELSATFLVDFDQARSARARGQSFNLIHSTTFLKVDVFPCVSPFNHEALRRAVAIDVPGASEPLRVASVEDIILSKLWWFRLGGEVSQVQQRDVRRLIELNSDVLDRDYMFLWSRALRITDLLDQALSR